LKFVEFEKQPIEVCSKTQKIEKMIVFKLILSIETSIFHGNYPIFYDLFKNVSQIFYAKNKENYPVFYDFLKM
jgi:hypothetical protein